MNEQALPRCFQTGSVAPAHHEPQSKQTRKYKMGLIYLSSCLFGFSLIWFSFRMQEGDMAAIVQVLGVIFNLPLLAFLFYLYQIVLEPLVKEAQESPATEPEA